VKGYDRSLYFPTQTSFGWFTITPMLQDLDFLAARVGQLVQLTRQLQSQYAAQQAKLNELEQERDALRTELQRRDAEYSSAAERFAQHEAELQAVREEARAATAAAKAEFDLLQSGMQVELSRFKLESEALKGRLSVTEADSSRLRVVATKAREQIDSILMRLPGAPQE
jgi:predicted nuclease with TOPRIM domain